MNTVRRVRSKQQKTAVNQHGNMENLSNVKDLSSGRASTESSIGSLRSLTDFTDVDQQLVLMKYFY